jgi:hypothetical protein
MLGRSVLVAIALAAVLPAVAPANTGSNGTTDTAVDVRIKPAKPNSRVSLRYATSLTRDDGSRVVAGTVHEIKGTLAKGFKFDVGAVPQCEESIIEDPNRGPGACPRGSIIGHGKATADARPLFADLIAANVTAYNGVLDTDVNGQPQAPAPALLVVADVPGLGVTVDLPASIHGSSLIIDLAPDDPNMPSPYTIHDLSLTLRRAGTDKKPYLRSPKSCPKGGWAFTETVVLTGGQAPVRAKDKIACSSD